MSRLMAFSRWKLLNPHRLPSREQTHRWLAWLFWTLAIIQVGFGFLLAILNQLSLERLFSEYVVSQALATLAFVVVGTLIISRRPDNVIGWIFCAAGIGNGVTAWTGQYTRYTMVTHPGALPAGELIAWLFFWSWMPVVASIVVLLPLLFPTGHLPSTRWRPMVWLAGVTTTLITVDLAISPGPLDASLPEVPNPYAQEEITAFLERFDAFTTPIGVLLILGSLASALAAQVIRYRRARGDERQQIKWFAYATAVLITAFVTPAVVDPSGFASPEGDTLLSGVLLAVAFPCLPIATGLAILRHRLYDIDLIINRTLVYLALTLGVLALYVFIVGYLSAIFRTGGNAIISLVATGVVAVLFQPLREWLQRGVNHLLYGQRDDPYGVVTGLGKRLEATLTPGDILPAIVQSIREALKLSYVAIATGRGRAFIVAAEIGTPSGQLLHLPLTYGNEQVGELRVTSHGPGEPFSTSDRRLLDDLARQVGVAVHAARVTADLQRSRQQLVTTQEEERRRIQRDLHDGLGPTLASMRLRLEGCLDVAQSTSPELMADLERLDELVHQASTDIRRLVYDLRPPSLDQLGIIPALRQHVERFNRETGIHAVFDAPDHLVLSAAVEVTVFRIVQEALVNVQKYAGARSVSIWLAQNDDWLTLELFDDGIGFDIGASALATGTGILSMRERAELLGGTLEIQSAPGDGTKLLARIPVKD